MKKLLPLALIAVLFMSCKSIAPLCATSNEVGTKVGRAKAGRILGFIPVGDGDYSIQKAAREAGITKISTVDVKTFNYFYIWIGNETIITGE